MFQERTKVRDPGDSKESAVIATSRLALKYLFYLAALILLPGALIGAPILWWIGRRNGGSGGRPATRANRTLWSSCG
jgi:hypothetical protein